MRHKTSFIILIFLATAINIGNAQNYSKYGTILRFSLKNGLFPHANRAEGHTYQNQFYPSGQHYQDSSVIVFVPKGYHFSKKTDIVVHFHGWFNHIDSVLPTFKLIEQFSEAHKNALLILPQGPKDAPDSFGGKLEESNGFKNFIYEVLDSVKIAKKKKVLMPHNIVLSGHSGAYRVMSFCLLQGGMPDNIREVWLFDGLYGQLEKYSIWVEQQNIRFVNFYTKEGGTFDTSIDFLTDLQSCCIPFWRGDESDLTDNVLKETRILNIFTPLEHNEVLAKTGMFKRLLLTSPFLKKK